MKNLVLKPIGNVLSLLPGIPVGSQGVFGCRDSFEGWPRVPTSIWAAKSHRLAVGSGELI